MWQAPAADGAVFGDVFKAGFLLDLFVRDNTVVLGRGQLPARQAAKLGILTEATTGNVDVFSSAFGGDLGLALGHAASSSQTAMLVSDSCAVATALVQGREKRSVGGRLLFVPLLTEPGLGLVDRLGRRTDFGRLALDAHPQWPEGAVAEMRNCFSVDARDVKAQLGSRVAALTARGANIVAARWAAFANRRGPHAYEINTDKIARVLAARTGAHPRQAHADAADATAEVLDTAWAMEGGNIEDVVDRYTALLDGGALPADTYTVLDELVNMLKALSVQAEAAAAAITAAR